MYPDKLLKSVEKPGRYCGGEYGQTIKDKNKVDARMVFCFPDTYEIGMSNLGVRILYGALNQIENFWCERAYAPWTDMEEKLKEQHIPLCAHESGDPLCDFDIVGFTLQYELCYTNVLDMLDLGGIPLLACDRGEDDPVVIGGGPCAYNAEPVADFFDVFSIGEGEEALCEFARLYIGMKKSGTYTREKFLREVSHLDGFYVPSLYDVDYNPDGTIKSFEPKFEDVPRKVVKRIIKDMDSAYFPDKLIMPYIETVHDRIMLEVYRGCIRGCRFCQACMLFRPVREKSPEVLDMQARKLYRATGYDEISLSSLSISDYSQLDSLCDRLLGWTDGEKVSLSLPSLRADSFTHELMDRISSVRTGGITFAPEAGTQRLRDVINKNIEEKDLFNACRTAFEAGKSSVKLYFMNGLPTETYDDLKGIADLAERTVDLYYTVPKEMRGKNPSVTISVACFIPKPFTAFQWEKQDDLETLAEKQKFLAGQITDRKIRYNWHDAEASRIEAVFARGNRKLCKALLEAHRRGVHFDSWDEYFDYDNWMDIFSCCGIDPAFYANREYGEDEILPWDHIDIGVDKSFFLRERKKAYEGTVSHSCREQCAGCGANRLGGERMPCPGSDKNQESADDEKVRAEVPEISIKNTFSDIAAGKNDEMLPAGPVRLRYAKTGRLKFISHLDLQRTFITTFSRAGIPVWYTEGFNPHPKLVFGLPLPLGVESLCEFLDIRLTRPMSKNELIGRINESTTGELGIQDAYVPQTKLNGIAWAKYEIRSPQLEKLENAALDSLLSGPVMITKKSKCREGFKTFDMIPLIKSYELGENVLTAVLCAKSESYLNPEHLTAHLKLDEYSTLRTAVYSEDGKTEFR